MADWQPGDLAMCVKSSRGGPGETFAGRVYTVESVWEHPNHGPTLSLCGVYNGHPNRGIASFWGHKPSRFVKVTPPEADEFDRQTIELENRKPVHVGGEA